MPIFVSHSSKDLDVVKHLARGLEGAGTEVWIGHDNIGGGEVWWDRILQSIRDSTLFLFAISDASITSEPCRLELDYARDLHRPVLPVQVGELANIRTNPVAHVQTIPYRPDDAQSGIAVLGAVVRLAGEPVPQLPDPMPPPPPIPFAYLIQIRLLIEHSEPTYEQQWNVIARLHRALTEEQEPSVRQDVLAMLRAVREKPWVAKRVESHIADLLQHVADTGKPPQETTPPPDQISTSDATVTTEPVGGVNLPDDGTDNGERPGSWALPATVLAGDPAPWHAVRWEPRHGATRNLAEDPAREGDPYDWFLDRMQKLPQWESSGSESTPSEAPTTVVHTPYRGVPASTGSTTGTGTTSTGTFGTSTTSTGTSGTGTTGTATSTTGETTRTRLSAPPRFRALGVVALIGLLPGIVALYFSGQVALRFAGGDVAGAEDASKQAKGWGIAGVVLGVLLWTVLAVIWSRTP